MRLFYIDFILEFWNDNPCADSASLIACLMTSIAADLCVPVNPSSLNIPGMIAGCFMFPKDRQLIFLRNVHRQLKRRRQELGRYAVSERNTLQSLPSSEIEHFPN